MEIDYESYRAKTKEAIECLQLSDTVSELSIRYGFRNQYEFLNKIKRRSRILVLGSGDGQLVADLRSARREFKIIDLNPAFVGICLPESNLRKRKNALAAINPELPFQDECFDLVVDEFASVYRSSSKTETLRRVMEINRVVKKGGLAMIGPIVFTDSNWVDEKMVKAKIDLKEVGAFWSNADHRFLLIK